jgi:hypothetical protein
MNPKRNQSNLIILHVCKSQWWQSGNFHTQSNFWIPISQGILLPWGHHFYDIRPLFQKVGFQNCLCYLYSTNLILSVISMCQGVELLASCLHELRDGWAVSQVWTGILHPRNLYVWGNSTLHLVLLYRVCNIKWCKLTGDFQTTFDPTSYKTNHSQ